MVTALLIQSVNLMLIGMASVFCFLWLLVLAVNLLSRIIQRHFPAPEKALDTSNTSLAVASVSPATIAAITAAIHQYRQQH